VLPPTTDMVTSAKCRDAAAITDLARSDAIEHTALDSPSPRAVGIPRSFSAAAMTVSFVTLAAYSSAIVLSAERLRSAAAESLHMRAVGTTPRWPPSFVPRCFAAARPRPLGEQCPEGQRASSTRSCQIQTCSSIAQTCSACGRHRGGLRLLPRPPLPECEVLHCRLPGGALQSRACLGAKSDAHREPDGDHHEEIRSGNCDRSGPRWRCPQPCCCPSPGRLRRLCLRLHQQIGAEPRSAAVRCIHAAGRHSREAAVRRNRPPASIDN